MTGFVDESVREGWIELAELLVAPADARGWEWRNDALCAQTDPDMFFPAKGGTAAPAKFICRRCPVEEQCRDWALANGEKWGVWGGLTERQRRRRGHQHEKAS